MTLLAVMLYLPCYLQTECVLEEDVMRIRKITSVILIGMALFLTSACGRTSGDVKDKGSANSEEAVSSEGSKTSSVSKTEIMDDTKKVIDINTVVTLGTYKGLKLTNPAPTEEEVDEEAQRVVDQTPIPDAAAQMSDQLTAHIEASLDGKEVKSEAGDETAIVLGNSGYSSEFDNQIVGMKADETKSFTIKLPSSYERNQELAGKSVTYTVTVYAIARDQELTEDWVAANTQYKSVDEFRESVRENLQQEADANKESTYRQEAIKTVVGTSKIKKYLKSEVDNALKQYDTNLENSLKASGSDLKTYKKENKLTDKAYEEERQKAALETAKTQMVILAIAKKQNFSVDDTGFSQCVTQLAQEYQMNEESLKSMFGEEDLRRMVTARRVEDYIIQNADVQ